MSHDADADAEFTDDLIAAKDAWSRHEIGPSMGTRLAAEAAGTLVLVAVGLGAAVMGMPYNQGMSIIPALGFGIAALVLIIALGHVSGAHFNPAVTVGLWAAGRFPGRDIAPYVLAQVVGAVGGGAVMLAVQDANPASDGGRASMNALSIGWGDHSPWGVGVGVALIAETVFTAALLATILSATSVKAPAHQAPMTIALGLTLLVVLAIPFTNGALNPARATGTAVFAEPWALSQLWAWWLAPLAGGLLAGLGYRAFGAAEDLETVQLVDAVTEE